MLLQENNIVTMATEHVSKHQKHTNQKIHVILVVVLDSNYNSVGNTVQCFVVFFCCFFCCCCFFVVVFVFVFCFFLFFLVGLFVTVWCLYYVITPIIFLH